jgi:hypothetical protein
VSIATSARIAVSILALTIAAAPVGAQQTAVRVPRSVLERYVGEYEYPSGAIIVVRLQGDTLVRQAWNQQGAYTALSATRFRLGDIGVIVDFVVEPSGGVTKIVNNDAGEIFRTTRKPLTATSAAKAAPQAPAQAAAPQPPGIPLPAAILERYVGQWKLPSGTVITFRRDGDKLYAKGGNSPELLLAARSDTRLQDPRGPIFFEFQVDANGTVTGLILEQGNPVQRTSLTRVP